MAVRTYIITGWRPSTIRASGVQEYHESFFASSDERAIEIGKTILNKWPKDVKHVSVRLLVKWLKWDAQEVVS